MPRSFSGLASLFVASLLCATAMAEETEGTERSRDSMALDEGLYAQPQPDDWNYALRLNG
jgi:hypothetical protein